MYLMGRRSIICYTKWLFRHRLSFVYFNIIHPKRCIKPKWITSKYSSIVFGLNHFRTTWNHNHFRCLRHSCLRDGNCFEWNSYTKSLEFRRNLSELRDTTLWNYSHAIIQMIYRQFRLEFQIFWNLFNERVQSLLRRRNSIVPCTHKCRSSNHFPIERNCGN